ncbi:hypothetical protein [Alicyclobacillus fastidiosus]|uniref:Uncharacterized protein n=1 Tax=Alicyclobacillus fastidiosus TaxID=392011 RepID=A0ABV5ALL3_9BACL|nr:hypothetical protein [Alicyclobacillus fastidiosus]WEH10216.1 hypothetical protein PYS47_02925 [Alicyclobacillus fastidiosus]
MHTLLIVCLVLLSILIVLMGIIAFIALTIYWTIEPILGALGKVSTGIEIFKFVAHRVQKWRDRRRRRRG